MKHRTLKMNALFEQEANMNTIAALSTIAVMKTDKNHAVINKQIQTDIVKVVSDVSEFKSEPSMGALPPATPMDLYFKDLTFTVEKMFSKSE